MTSRVSVRWRAHGFALIAVVSALLIVGTSMQAASGTPASHPAVSAKSGVSASINGVTFDPGYIISDPLFYNGSAMTQSQIQSFLDMKIGTCQNTLCLNVYKMSTPNRAADRTICTSYTGAANESVAAIIYKVQKACGISAKVLLATLQKEQGLVTNTAPTSSRLKIAMGYACPDTAVCDSKYYGFFNQVYSAAWQFKRYSTPDPWGNIQPGTESILYNPDTSCGRKTVYVRNNATAALYNYTPYTPNAAALTNLYGAAPPCGSYGNRNFWVFYNSWFGTSIGGSPVDAINSLYLVLGGATGKLGAAGPVPTCATSASSCFQTYAHGVIYWTPKSGPIAVAGTIGDYYLASGGVGGMLGIPLVNDQTVTDPHGNGTVQSFSKGVVHSSALGTFTVRGSIMSAYSAAGWLRGSLGWPAGEAACGTSGACVQQFAGGMIAGVPTGTAGVLKPAIATLYTSLGGPTGTLGLAMSAPTNVTDPHGNGQVMGFQYGLVYSSERGTFVVKPAIQAAYSAAGWLRGFLGWPTTDEVCATDGCTQTFAGGAIFAPVSGAAYVTYAVTHPAIKTVYEASGGASGPLGAAKGPAAVVIDAKNGNGVVQKFQNGWIHSSAKGTYALTNAVMTAYSAAGWVRGPLGWPTGADVCSATGCLQSFAGGGIRTPLSGVAFPVAKVTNIAIRGVYDASGGPTGPLGYAMSAGAPVTDLINGNGYAQRFEGGWIHAGPAGTWWSPTAIMTAYSAKGWVRGTLGWPSGAAVCDATGCVQHFQHGTIDTH